MISNIVLGLENCPTEHSENSFATKSKEYVKFSVMTAFSAENEFFFFSFEDIKGFKWYMYYNNINSEGGLKQKVVIVEYVNIV